MFVVLFVFVLAFAFVSFVCIEVVVCAEAKENTREQNLCVVRSPLLLCVTQGEEAKAIVFELFVVVFVFVSVLSVSVLVLNQKTEIWKERAKQT